MAMPEYVDGVLEIRRIVNDILSDDSSLKNKIRTGFFEISISQSP